MLSSFHTRDKYCSLKELTNIFFITESVKNIFTAQNSNSANSVYGKIMVSLASLWFSSFMTFHSHWLWLLIGQERIIRCRKWNKVNVRTQKYSLNDISRVVLELCGSDREKKCPKVSCKHFMALKLNTQKSGNIIVAFSVILFLPILHRIHLQQHQAIFTPQGLFFPSSCLYIDCNKTPQGELTILYHNANTGWLS